MEILLWLLIFVVAYSYVGYGIFVWLLLKIRGKYPALSFRNDYEPTVSLIVPCFNEQDYILEKVHNSLALDYPKDKLEVLFISDGSNDNTASILSGVQGIIHMHEDRRSGKALAMNRAVNRSSGEIIVFCDANTALNQEAIRLLVRHYIDPKTGGVSGEKKIAAPEASGASSAGEGIYWKYESFLKKCDSDLYTVVGAAGELMSYRRSLYQELEPDTLLDDFMQSMRIVLRGYRMIYEPGALAVETASANVKEELKRKIRICAGGWQSMVRLAPAFNIFKRPVVAFEFISHRALRWSLAAFALPFILLLNILLALDGNVFYTSLLAAQVVFYMAALAGWYLENRNTKVKVLYVPYYFFIMNLSVFLGFKRYLKGEQSALWDRAKRA